jgi:hypothetical protein
VPRRTPLGCLVAVLATACSSGSSSPAPVTLAARASGEQVGVCTAVVGALPQSLAGQARRPTRPAPETTAAWGRPPITLVCGVPPGSALDDPYEFDGVTWAVHDIGNARTWTTKGRAVNVVVTVPDAYDGQAELLGSLAGALAATAR